MTLSISVGMVEAELLVDTTLAGRKWTGERRLYRRDRLLPISTEEDGLAGGVAPERDASLEEFLDSCCD
ncbi:hypothetical protein OsJ_24975 [Oryza sativa Japonica Group]|uniref:Uncharacterized protein n=1 Tax=Oryza sativa subsp. japonica TaxID=39947 RepID=B9FY82_ORYSJ|nr:hypothetical protein OsJ_24975 [Oryza sativa Japonica Group]